MRRKIIGIGETLLDVVFQGNQPSVAVPGGSVFNGMVSLGRLGINVCFISDTGNDRVGSIILDFMRRNNLSTDYINIIPDWKSPLSLAFLNKESNAEYLFYKDRPIQGIEYHLPDIQEDDIVIFGSFYALDPALRERMLEVLEVAKTRKAIIYYDPNFRSSHKNEAVKLSSTLIENLEYADIVRGSNEDFRHLYQMEEADRIYKNKIQFYCPNFLCTYGDKGVSLRTAGLSCEYASAPIHPVSTIGAGDNFNAGILYGLLKYDIRRADLDTLSEKQWEQVIHCGLDFSAEVCCSFDNYISQAFADNYAKG